MTDGNISENPRCRPVYFAQFLRLYLNVACTRWSIEIYPVCPPFHFFSFRFFSKWDANFKTAISQRSTEPKQHMEVQGWFFPITLTVTCFVCVRDLQVIAWPALTRSKELWIKISYLQPVASKADFHYLRSAWLPAPHPMLFLGCWVFFVVVVFCLSLTRSNTYKFIPCSCFKYGLIFNAIVKNYFVVQFSCAWLC